MTDAAMLLSANRAFVIAPAGCGKTELIAQSVHQDVGHRSLVLTHTYAGVDSLRKRLKTIGAKASTYEVDTIAGWSLRLVVSFPSTSAITTERPVNEQWNDVYRAASRILLIRAIKTVVRASFDSVYVDEYQDCSPLQHDIVLKLAEIIPARILGDPLQGIFDFGRSEIVDWQIHVRPHFDELPTLSEPHRWVAKNPTLGSWLLRTRESLEAGQPVDLRAAPNGCLRFLLLPPDRLRHGNIQRDACMSAICRNDETLIAIQNWESQCHNIARQSGGKFQSPEAIECDELFKAAKALDDAPDRCTLARTAFEFACLCLTKIKTELEGPSERIFNGRGLQASRHYQRQEQLDALANIVEEGSLSSVKSALMVLARTRGTVKARYELFREMLNALSEHETRRESSLYEAAIRARNRTRRTGRAPGALRRQPNIVNKGFGIRPCNPT